MDFYVLVCFLSFVYLLFRVICKLKDQRDQSCYILDYECYKPSDNRKLNTELKVNILKQKRNLGLDEFKFLFKVTVNSGIGEETYVPKSLIQNSQELPSFEDGILEMEECFYDNLDTLFSNSKISPLEIDFLVVNVSTFSPMPSLAARIVNRYKLREDIKIFNLSGMGCSASLISINLVQNMFKLYKNAFALILSTEAMGSNWYLGTNRSMLLPGLLFRSGGSAILLTNNPSLRHRAKFKIHYVIRTHLGADKDAYQCIRQEEDEDGYLGFYLSKTLPKAAVQALTLNLRELAPKILPVRELLHYFIVSGLKRKAFINFKRSIHHFVIHTGGKAVIDGIGKKMGLTDYDLEPSRMALHRFGNTSSSSIWYVLAYMEAKKRLRKGDRVLMLSLGSGFKCNSCMLEVVSNLKGENVWKDCVDRYPPETTINLLKDKYEWINHEDPSTFRVPA